MALFDTTQFIVAKAKPLPVIFLLDTSGSMSIVVNPDEVVRTGRKAIVDGQQVEYVEGGRSRIDLLNEAVRTMLANFKKEESQSTEFLVSVISFGGTATVIQRPASASASAFTHLTASGMTPLGSALNLAKNLVEDKESTPSRAYRPLVVLVSDGEPDHGWEGPLADFIGTGRSAKCDRMALGIGEEAIAGHGRKALERFVEGTGHPIFEAKDASEIHKFFEFVTMSVVTRSQSQNPNDLSATLGAMATPPTSLPPLVPQTTVREDAPPTVAYQRSVPNVAAPPAPPAAPAATTPTQPAAAPPPARAVPTTTADDEDDYW